MWDNTRVLGGEPGQYIAIARRSGNDWYLGGMTNDQPCQMTLPLDFVGPGTYEAALFSDTKERDDPNVVSVSKQWGHAADVLPVILAVGGGLAAIIKSVAAKLD